MNPNIKIAEKIAFLGGLDPASVAAGTVLTSWVSMGNVDSILALIHVGAFGASATVDAKLRQAQDASGTNAKDVLLPSGSSRAIATLLAAGGNNVKATIECRDTDLDANNGFGYVALSITVGAAATILSAELLGGNPVYVPAGAFNAASVVQQVG